MSIYILKGVSIHFSKYYFVLYCNQCDLDNIYAHIRIRLNFAFWNNTPMLRCIIKAIDMGILHIYRYKYIICRIYVLIIHYSIHAYGANLINHVVDNLH